MPKSLYSETIQEIDYSAILNQYVYSDDQNKIYENKTISEIIEISQNLKNDETLKAALEKYPEIGDFVLVSQSSFESHNSTGENFSMNHIIACTFKNPDTNDYYVAYRGTGDGKWVDNGEAMTIESSLMQQAAADYFDSVVKSENLDGENIGRIIVTGHSKGGNSAQFTTMFSQNSHLIDNCYSIDGQGFSAKAIEAFKAKWGNDYQLQIEKMYSINGQNDYVHDLGYSIINEEQTYFVKTHGNDFTSWHSLSNMFSDGQFGWDYTVDENGNKTYNFDLPQDSVGKFAKELSANLMSLPEEELNDCAISIMTLIEKFMSGGEVYKQGTGNRAEATFEEYIGLFTAGLPIVINTAINCEDTRVLLESFNIDSDILVLFDEIQLFAKNKGINDFCGYIAEDPLRLIEVYTSLDLSKKMVNEAVVKVLAAGTVAKLLISAIFPTFSVMLNVVAAAGIIYLVANHIVKNWDTICEKAELIADYVKDEIVKFYNDAKQAVQTGINHWLGSVCTIAEKCITMGDRVVNKFIDGAADFWDSFKKKAIDSVKALLFVANPLIYIIASKVYKANKEPVRINFPRIRDCVDRMNNLARRVANIDARLDNLYWRLAQNNIEKEEGIFTSLANMYNLFRADLNVDEGAAIKRKARALSDLYDGYESTEKWVMDNVPQKI